ncbi:MAG: hypothetical protein GY716_12880 [bacterium]|nr:hypothetical protein [bacterium]
MSRARHSEGGFSLIEMLVAMSLTVVMFLAVMLAYDEARKLDTIVNADVTVQGNLRLAMDRVERDLRMIGFGVPTGERIGGTSVWTPSIFHATPTQIGFRSEIDGGYAEVTCTPALLNTDCPLNRLRLDSVSYYASVGCGALGGGSGGTAMVVISEDEEWLPITCSAVNQAQAYLTTSTMPSATFAAGSAKAVTLEQVYYTYTASSQSPYGTVTKSTRYANTPSSTFPPTGAQWTTIGSQLTDFWLEYHDEAGAVLSGNPLSATQREQVRSIVIFMQGYEQVNAQGDGRVIELRSEILRRNPES